MLYIGSFLLPFDASVPQASWSDVKDAGLCREAEQPEPPTDPTGKPEAPDAAQAPVSFNANAEPELLCSSELPHRWWNRKMLMMRWRMLLVLISVSFL